MRPSLCDSAPNSTSQCSSNFSSSTKLKFFIHSPITWAVTGH
jgi:hypothetical protein